MSFDLFDALTYVGVSVPRSDGPQQIRCPVHAGGQERNPSARLYPDTQLVHCFRCGETWNPISLVARVRGISYRDAKTQLAVEYGEYCPPAAHLPRVDAMLAEAIEQIRFVAAAERWDSYLDLGTRVLLPALRGEPVWELKTALEAWHRRWFPHLH